MARIAGINIPPHQHADIGLTAIYGIGRSKARAILDSARVPYTKKVKELNDAELERIREEIARATVEGDLRLPAIATAPDRTLVVGLDLAEVAGSMKSIRGTIRRSW